jgi:hypothetical protein
MSKKDLRQIKDYKLKGLTKEDIQEAAKRANVSADMSVVSGGDIKSVEDTVAKYENKSEGELMGDLAEMISSGRKDGTFSDEMLESFIKNVSPMMDSAQKKKLCNIVNMIKDKNI